MFTLKTAVDEGFMVWRFGAQVGSDGRNHGGHHSWILGLGRGDEVRVIVLFTNGRDKVLSPSTTLLTEVRIV